MSTWVIGDLQGCHASLQALLVELGFNRTRDHLIFVGDLVNRGPDSEGCLRTVRRLCEAGCARTVLGNHDLHLLAAAAGLRKPNADDTLGDILQAADRNSLLDWLARQPLMIAEDAYSVAHAGLHPDWSPATASECAREVELELAGARREAFLGRMYGNRPARWQDCGDAETRQRFTVNVFTRMRFIGRADHALMLKAKGSAEAPPESGMPWFVPRSRDARPIYFGHWSTLGTIAWPQHVVYGLDTGCVWGGALTAMDPANGAIVSVSSAPGDARPPI